MYSIASVTAGGGGSASGVGETGKGERTLVDILLHEPLRPVKGLAIQPEALRPSKVAPQHRMQHRRDPLRIVLASEVAESAEDAADERGVVVGVLRRGLPRFETEVAVHVEGAVAPLLQMRRRMGMEMGMGCGVKAQGGGEQGAGRCGVFREPMKRK